VKVKTRTQNIYAASENEKRNQTVKQIAIQTLFYTQKSKRKSRIESFWSL